MQIEAAAVAGVNGRVLRFVGVVDHAVLAVLNVGIENTVLTKPQTPEMVLEEKQLQKQVYFRHSCTFCTPHFFYINSNKTTAGRTKAIHRRLELSFNLYLLLLLWVKTELPKASYI